MTKKIKKSVSILLALVMLCGVLAVAPITVGAEEQQDYTTDNNGAKDKDGNPIIGIYNLIPDEDNHGMYELHLKSGRFTGTAWQKNRTWTADFSQDKVSSITADEGVIFTDDCKDMFRFFTECTSIDLSGVDTENVTSMSCMFEFCENLTNINISCFKTNNVESIEYMFANCPKLTTLDLSSFSICLPVATT